MRYDGAWLEGRANGVLTLVRRRRDDRTVTGLAGDARAADPMNTAERLGSPTAIVPMVRTGAHDGFDRIVFEGVGTTFPDVEMTCGWTHTTISRSWVGKAREKTL